MAVRCDLLSVENDCGPVRGHVTDTETDTAVALRFSVRFPKGFQWGLGGTLPGLLLPGVAQARFAWRRGGAGAAAVTLLAPATGGGGGGGGESIAAAAAADDSSSGGAVSGESPTQPQLHSLRRGFRFRRGEWHELQLLVSLGAAAAPLVSASSPASRGEHAADAATAAAGAGREVGGISQEPQVLRVTAWCDGEAVMAAAATLPPTASLRVGATAAATDAVAAATPATADSSEPQQPPPLMPVYTAQGTVHQASAAPQHAVDSSRGLPAAAPTEHFAAASASRPMLLLGCFFGGSDPGWAAPEDSFVDMGGFGAWWHSGWVSYPQHALTGSLPPA